MPPLLGQRLLTWGTRRARKRNPLENKDLFLRPLTHQNPRATPAKICVTHGTCIVSGMKTTSLVVLTLAVAVSSALFGQHADNSLPSKEELAFLQELERVERAKLDVRNPVDAARWTLRSRHFVFGMPRLEDDRHNFTPDASTEVQAGVTIIVREAFVVGHFDRMKAPLWVAQRWTAFDSQRMDDTLPQSRPWREDLVLPMFARGGTSYDGNNTQLDRGHMARHAMNRAWGIDSSNFGTKMSNSAPQHRNINRLGGTWGKLEDEIRDVVARPESDVEALWTICGAIFRDSSNPSSESPEKDFASVARIRGGFGVPDATYRVVSWFDGDGRFQARAYVFEQPHTASGSGDQIKLTFDLGKPDGPLADYLVRIDDLEQRIGVDFFPMLRDNIEDLIERTRYSDLWGAE